MEGGLWGYTSLLWWRFRSIGPILQSWVWDISLTSLQLRGESGLALVGAATSHWWTQEWWWKGISGHETWWFYEWVCSKQTHMYNFRKNVDLGKFDSQRPISSAWFMNLSLLWQCILSRSSIMVVSFIWKSLLAKGRWSRSKWGMEMGLTSIAIGAAIPSSYGFE